MGDIAGDDTGDGPRWLTYVEIGAALRIKPASARRLAQRKPWPRRQNNRGEAIVGVPVEALPNPTVAPDVAPDVASDPVIITDPLLLARLEAQIAGLRELVEAERARADAAAAERDRWHHEATRPILSRLFGRRA